MVQHLKPAFSEITWNEDIAAFLPDAISFAKLSHAAGVCEWSVIMADRRGLYLSDGNFQSSVSESDLLKLRWQPLPGLGWVGVSQSSPEASVESFLQLLASLISTGMSHSAFSSRDALTLADSLPFLVSCIDLSFNYEFVNQLYVDLYDRPREEFYGAHVREVIGDGQFQQVKPLLDRAIAGEKVDQQIVIVVEQEGGGAYERFVDCVFTPRLSGERVTGVYVCIHDQTFIKRTTSGLQRLHSITARDDLSIDNKIQQILELGCEIFHLPFGIVSHVVGDNYSVEYCYSPNGEIEAGAQFNLGDCYCVHTLARKEVTGFYHAGASEIATHPCYEQFQLEAYLGMSIYVDGRVWGTLNFSSPRARSKDFSADEYELVKLFAQWVGSTLTRRVHDAALSNAERRHRLILESVHDGILGVNEHCSITFVNGAAASLTGYAVDELIGQHVSILLRPHDQKVDDRPPRCFVQGAISSGESIDADEAVFYEKTGWSFPVMLSCYPVTDQVGLGDVGAVITFQDVTEQRVFQDALTKQMELFRSLFMDAPEAVVVVDENRMVQMANPHSLSMFGYSEEQLVGKTPDFLYADKASYEKVGDAYAAEDSPDRSEYRMVYQRADGSTFVAENVRSKILDQDGALRGFIIHARDISARLAIEADIKKARDRLSIATLSAGIGVWEMDVDTRELIWDEQMVAIYGIEVPIGTPFGFEEWAALVHPEDLVKIESAATHSAETGDNFDMDFRVTLPSGENRYIKANARVVCDSYGHPSYFLGVNYDVTERYQTEAILKRAREEAIQASQAKSNFLATVSHEIRTPLNGVLGMAEILAGSELTDRQRYQIDVIRNSGENLLELINEILDFSKIEAGHLTLEPIDFDLEKLVFDLARLLVVKAEAKGVDLLVQYNLKGCGAVNGDAYRVRQILTNLVGNAIKFTQEGEIIIRVDGQQDSATGNWDVSISVSDTGIGIAAHVQPNLFLAFTQADNSTTRKFGGTGLGLAISKQLVDLMGGDISLSSELGVGTTFTVALPLVQSAGTVEPESHDEIHHFNRVLVVDDNDTNLSILEDQLGRCNINAEFESSSPAAFEKVLEAYRQRRAYDLLILDYLMPDMDGLELSRQVHQQLPVGERPKVLMISSAGSVRSSDLEEAGVQVCINKPTSVRELSLGLSAVSNMNAEQKSMTQDITSFEEVSHASGELAGVTILVVEDMQANLAVAQGMLAQLGVRVEIAENGEEGVQKWLETSPDIILMDLHMPVMDGLTAIRTIRGMETGVKQRVPILALTADIQPESMAQVVAAGGDGYISKPFKRTELLEAITDRLFNKAAGSALNKRDQEVIDSGKAMNYESVDESVLAGLEEVLGDQVNDIVAAFVHDAKGVFQTFTEVSERGNDQEALHRPSHSLKSISANVGAFQLSEMAGALEKDVQSGVQVDISSRIDDLNKEYERVRDQLKQLGKLL